MTSTASQSAALVRIIALWAAMIAEVFGIIVGLIVAMAGNVRNSLHELGAYALARKPSPDFGKAVMEVRIKALSAKPWPFQLSCDLADAGERPRGVKGRRPMI